MDDWGDIHSDDGHSHGEGIPDHEHPLWKTDRIELRSIGIDIGSTTSHVMISEMILQRQGRALSSRFQIVSKKIVYESRILLTPFLYGTTIDTETLSEFIAGVYTDAGIMPDAIDTGAVVLTGEAARKENAEAIAELFAVQAGKFVCATAGPNLETRMAAYGSGAVDRSLDGGGKGSTIMNVDIGGGTSKIAIVREGCVIDTISINVGARLVAFDDSGTIVRIEDAARVIAGDLGFGLELGQRLGEDQKAQMAKALAGSLVEAMERKKLSPLAQKLMMTPTLCYTGEVNAILFSGGVSEYIYGYECGNYGDLGGLLAREVKALVSIPEFGIPVEEPVQRIRATVIGASQYTVQVSGSTIFISQDDILPLRNLQVVTPRIQDCALSIPYVAEMITESFRQNDIIPGECPVALAFHWVWEPSHELIKALVKGIMSALGPIMGQGIPMVLVFDADIGRLVGNMLKEELSVNDALVSIDGIDLQDFDYIDIGKQMPDSHVVPVVIKSLIFRPCVDHDHDDDHDHDHDHDH